MLRIKPERPQLVFLRVCLAATLIAILFLATTHQQMPVAANISDKFNHALAFFVLAWLTDRAFPGKTFWKTKALPLLAYGIGIECLQYFLPFREFSILDMLADGAGLIVYRVVMTVVKITNDGDGHGPK